MVVRIARRPNLLFELAHLFSLELRELKARTFQLTVHPARPETQLTFRAAPSLDRRTHWATADGTWQLSEQTETLRAAEPRDAFRFRVRIPDDARDTGYDVCITLESGDQLVYLPAFVPSSEGGASEPAKLSWRFSGAEGRSVAVADERAPRLRWPSTSSRDHDTYAHFGSARVDRSRRADLLLDDALPQWVAQSVGQVADAALHEYAEGLGITDLPRPKLAVGYERRTADTRGTRGGAVNRFAYLMLSGRGWQRSETSYTHLTRSIAHELFHLYNGAYAQPEGALWLWEGAASYAAKALSVRIGALSATDARTQLIEIANRCAGVPVSQRREALAATLAAVAKRGKLTVILPDGRKLTVPCSSERRPGFVRLLAGEQ